MQKRKVYAIDLLGQAISDAHLGHVLLNDLPLETSTNGYQKIEPVVEKAKDFADYLPAQF